MPIRIPDRPEQSPKERTGRAMGEGLAAFLKRDLIPLGKGLNDQGKERLFREMHLLLNAGVDPRSVLDLLLKAQRDGTARRILDHIRTQVLNGSLLSAAMAQAGVFTEYEVQSIRIGEESGRLVEVCVQLADHHAERIKLRRMIQQAFAYPLFIFTITIAVVFFMMNVVVPMFAQVFARSGSELPALTRFVLSVSDAIRGGWHVALVLLLGIVALWYVLRSRPAWKVWQERFIWRIPIMGHMARTAILARYCRSMAFLLGADSPLDRALELSERMCGSPHMEKALVALRYDVVSGRSLGEGMSKHRIFDEQLVAMIGVAEEVKQLDVMFLRLSERYTAELQQRTNLLGSVLEPATILLIAVLVGVVLVAMYLPMFKLSTTF